MPRRGPRPAPGPRPSPPPQLRPADEPRRCPRGTVRKYSEFAGQTHQVLSLVHVITRLRECHAKTQALRTCDQRIKRSAGSHPLHIKQLGLDIGTADEVVATVSGWTHHHVRTVEEMESLVERLRGQLRAVAIDSDHTAVSPADEDAEGRDETRGKTLVLLSDDFDHGQPTGEIGDI